MVRHIKLSLAFLGQNIKQLLADRANFWAYLLTTILYQATFIIFLWVIFRQTPDIRGWGFYEVLFIYGFFSVVSGLFYTFFAWTLWFGEKYVLGGKLDLTLTYPLNPYQAILLSELGNSIMELLSVALGIGILVFAAAHLALIWTPLLLIKLLICLFAGLLTLSGLFTAAIALSFWLRGRNTFVSPLMYAIQFAQYPLDIYAGWLRRLLTFIVPIGFVGFYPAAALLRATEYAHFFALALFCGAVTFTVGVGVWHYGLRRYDSVGN